MPKVTTWSTRTPSATRLTLTRLRSASAAVTSSTTERAICAPTRALRNRAAARGLFDDQLRVTLALGAPALLLLSGWAPLALHLLYAEAFTPAARLLQWQAAGDAVKPGAAGASAGVDAPAEADEASPGAGAVVVGVGINAFFYGFSVLQFVQYRTRLFRDSHLTQ